MCECYDGLSSQCHQTIWRYVLIHSNFGRSIFFSVSDRSNIRSKCTRMNSSMITQLFSTSVTEFGADPVYCQIKRKSHAQTMRLCAMLEPKADLLPLCLSSPKLTCLCTYIQKIDREKKNEWSKAVVSIESNFVVVVIVCL